MISKRSFIITTVAIAALGYAGAAIAGDVKTFDKASFEAAQKAGQPILVQIHATWCPTCKAQAPILSKLESQTPYDKIVVFNVDFDSQKDVVRGFGANMQSTLITFKGAKETARSVGDTNAASIETLLKSSI